MCAYANACQENSPIATKTKTHAYIHIYTQTHRHTDTQTHRHTHAERDDKHTGVRTPVLCLQLLQLLLRFFILVVKLTR
jgi:hypothetical protein